MDMMIYGQFVEESELRQHLEQLSLMFPNEDVLAERNAISRALSAGDEFRKASLTPTYIIEDNTIYVGFAEAVTIH